MKIPKGLANILSEEVDEGEIEQNFKCVHDGKWEDDGKYDHKEKIFQNLDDNKFYALYESRSGSHYTDYYYSSSDWQDKVDLLEVIKTEKTIIEWVTPRSVKVG